MKHILLISLLFSNFAFSDVDTNKKIVQDQLQLGLRYQGILFISNQKGYRLDVKDLAHAKFYLEQAAKGGSEQAAQNFAEIKYIYEGGKLEYLNNFLNLMEKEFDRTKKKSKTNKEKFLLIAKTSLQRQQQLFIKNNEFPREKLIRLIKSACQNMFKS